MPRVSIGLPVYNGERFLRECLESLAAQTFSDFEVVICDNASTDRTEEICREFASRDSRFRYFRNPRNLGAGPNYNLTFERAVGEYFKWAAHDDLCAPAFLERCVALLDEDRGAVVAFPKMVDIDESGKSLGTRNISHIPRGERGAVTSPNLRFRRLIKTDYTVEEIFGLIRSDVLRRTSLIQSYTDSDRTLLAELGLYGRIVEVPEVLFFHRLHPGMSTRAFPQWQDRTAWFDPAMGGRRVFPLFRQFGEYFRCIMRSPVTVGEKALCCIWMANWLRHEWRGLASELTRALIPPGKTAGNRGAGKGAQ